MNNQRHILSMMKPLSAYPSPVLRGVNQEIMPHRQSNTIIAIKSLKPSSYLIILKGKINF